MLYWHGSPPTAMPAPSIHLTPANSRQPRLVALLPPGSGQQSFCVHQWLCNYDGHLQDSMPSPTSRLHFQGQLCFCRDALWNFRLISFRLKCLLPPNLLHWINSACSHSVTWGKCVGPRALAVAHPTLFPTLLTQLSHHRGSKSWWLAFLAAGDCQETQFQPMR